MFTSLQFIPSAPSQSAVNLDLQHSVPSQQPQSQSLTSSNISPATSNSKSDKSLQERSSQNSTEPDITVGYVSLKSIKSKQEIELQSRENEEILTNLNFNIDDLFRKISSLTDEITTELQPRLIKERSSPQKVYSPKKIVEASTQQELTESTHQQNQPQSKLSKSCQKQKSPYKPLFPQLQQLVQLQSTYKPIFFQPYRPLTPQYSINMKLFQTGKSLGCGKFGQVVQCRNVKTGALYALKKIFKSVIEEYHMEEQLLTELQILKQINHPNIVRAYESFTDDFHIFILMEYIHGPLLVKKLKCSQLQCKVIIRQVLQVLKYLHENKITHRDIKPQNIIMTADNIVKICDFGWAAQGEQKMNILCGTLDYVSPQMANQQEYTEKGDLWNLGVLTYELIHGYAPFRGSSKSRIFEKVRNLDYEFSEQIEISQQCRDFISGFLRKESERESIEWGLKHEFLKMKQEPRQMDVNQESVKQVVQFREQNEEIGKEIEELLQA